ncbi:hypothetical protein GTP45_01230 [Pseudoduganella sp. FT55W]|uniref:Uncharacterized protein n=1 Tax=Duganella rivi TaxID=2666083 RepID=A0A7X4K9U7_9BURK|nr:hypothetical protein [Duganella rivi]MYM65455.1 hypothetical protein [Duganella rivi]
MALSVVMAIAALVGCSQRDDSDPPGGRSGLLIYTDNLTGCQYLSRPRFLLKPEPLAPRMRADGTQVCVQDSKAR